MNKPYIYFAMAFSLLVAFLNIRVQRLGINMRAAQESEAPDVE